MTSLTTVLALTPMALGGPGAESNVPLARAIIGGVLSAALLTLVVVPCLYVIIQGVRSTRCGIIGPRHGPPVATAEGPLGKLRPVPRLAPSHQVL